MYYLPLTQKKKKKKKKKKNMDCYKSLTYTNILVPLPLYIVLNITAYTFSYLERYTILDSAFIVLIGHRL
jgi:hypothetical protein